MKLPRFERRSIEPLFFGQHEIDEAKARHYAKLMLGGTVFPPAPVARYGDRVLPIDGHHRLRAYQIIGQRADVWECDGDAYDDFSCRVGSHEADRAILNSLCASGSTS